MAALVVALTGNPNAGKSTIFNELTGARQKTGNWPGVTVDQRIGSVDHRNLHISIVDLPGTYSVDARSPEERIVVDYLLHHKVDMVVDVVDSTNLERNLYLTVQLLEKGIPLLIDLNMQDEAARRGVKIDARRLGEALGMPVVETVGNTKAGREKLLEAFHSTVMLNYEPSQRLQTHIEAVRSLQAGEGPADQVEEALAARRYALIDEIVAETVTAPAADRTVSERIDAVLANGWTALPALFLMGYLMFQITFAWIGQPLADALGDFIGGPLKQAVAARLEAMAVSAWMQSLILDGIVDGVGSVLTFVPLIFVLFFCLSFLDGTGYMARVAFITDPVMRRAGLNGKGIMPLMMGFGCAVPAIMGARTLDSEKDRLTAMLVTPFLTCGAKLPVMALFAVLFFPENAGGVVFLMYALGIVMAVISAKVLSATVFRGEASTFLLELPPYRVPDMKTVLLETWDKGRGYVVRAGTVIFVCCVFIWFLGHFNFRGMAAMDESFLASLGAAMSSLFAFHGFASWEAGAAVIAGILAKESVVSTMGILYQAGELSVEAEEVAETASVLAGTGMASSFSPLSAFAFMVFSQLYTPCVTALGTIRKEAGTWKWAVFSAVYMFAAAWAVSLAVYQLGRLLGF